MGMVEDINGILFLQLMISMNLIMGGDYPLFPALLVILLILTTRMFSVNNLIKFPVREAFHFGEAQA